MKRRTFTSLVAGLRLAAGMMASNAMAQDNKRIALVDTALGIGFYLGYAELAYENGAPCTSTRRPTR